MADTVLETTAAVAAVAHAHKHPTRPVLGILIGTIDGSAVRVSQAIPLFHTGLLAPMFEAAMLLVEAHCKKAGLRVVGCYSGSKNVHDNNISPTAKLVGNEVRKHCPEAVVLQLNNLRLAAQHLEEAFKLYRYSGATWGEVDAASEKGIAFEAGLDVVKGHLEKLLLEGGAAGVVDFDDHLEDVSLDFFNQELLKGL